MSCDSIDCDAIRKIAEYGDVYVEKILQDPKNYASPDKIITDCCESLNFFFGHCFFQGNRNDELAKKVDRNARDVVYKYRREMNNLGILAQRPIK